MNIIQRITTSDKNVSDNKSNLQKISLDQLRINPIPNSKNEVWRLTNKSKFYRFLDFKYSNDFYAPDIPGYASMQNICRIIIGENKRIKLKEDKWEIRELKEEEILNFLQKKIIKADSTNNWCNLLNHFLTDNKNIIGLNISGKEIPQLEIICNSMNNFLNAKTLIINVEEDTSVSITQINIGDKNSALSTSSYFIIGKDAEVNHGIISYGKNKSHIINTLNVWQHKNSEYNLGSLQFEYDFGRLEISINQVEGNAKTNIKGIQITKNNEQISTYANIEFNGPNGFLDQLNKSLANDKSHSVFEGLIIVPQIAQKTDASQLSRNLLLSNYARIDTKPQLEIVADDVKCMHGATISQLNEDEVFYMRSRGLTLEEASKLQLRSYYQEIISFLPISKERWDILALLLKNK